MPTHDPLAAPKWIRNDLIHPYTIAAADGAITVKSGLVLVTKATAAALTLAAPVAGADDGKSLTILSTTAAAHTVTNASPGFNGGGAGSDLGTFGGAKGDNIVLLAYGGAWYVVHSVNVTLS